MKKAYSRPEVVCIANFRDDTKGVWFGSCRDIFGGRAFICIG